MTKHRLTMKTTTLQQTEHHRPTASIRKKLIACWTKVHWHGSEEPNSKRLHDQFGNAHVALSEIMRTCGVDVALWAVRTQPASMQLELACLAAERVSFLSGATVVYEAIHAAQPQHWAVPHSQLGVRASAAFEVAEAARIAGDFAESYAAEAAGAAAWAAHNAASSAECTTHVAIALKAAAFAHAATTHDAIAPLERSQNDHIDRLMHATGRGIPRRNTAPFIRQVYSAWADS